MKKSGFIFAFFLFLAVGNALFAFGRKQAEEEITPVNPEWILSITAIDVSAMSPAWQTAGDTVARSLAGALQNLDFRFREEDETYYYRNYAWVKSRASVFDALERRRNDRDLLIFKGDPLWKYEKDLKTVEAAIQKLEEDLAEIDANTPEIEPKPIFSLSEKNLAGTFPLPPKPGGEYRFCADEKADAFLTGSLSEYYGRIYLDLKMYSRYTTSYSYENSILFSSEDFNKAIEEISDHLAVAVSVKHPSAVLVRSSAPDAMVLIDGTYAGQGEIESRSRSPGTAEIAVLADNHAPFSLPLELYSGELTELYVDLTPLGRTILSADVPDKPGSRVYQGALYVGEAPLTLELPETEFSYISVETQDSEVGSLILRDNNLVRGNAIFSGLDNNVKADFLTSIPVSKEEKRTENSRNSFYKAYGVFWIALPVALLASGIAGTYIAANNFADSNNTYRDPGTRDRMNSNASFGSLIQTLSYGLIGSSLGVTFYQIYKYLKNSSGDSTPIVKVAPKAEN